MNPSQVALKTRVQLQQFLGIFSPHFSRPETKFLGDMLYGLQAGKDIKLSCISRALDEPITLKKTEERLSRHLAKAGLAEKVQELIARQGARQVGRDTLLVIDPTDIRKFYARRMPYLGRIRDGSEGTEGLGYWACAAVACESGGRRILPLHLRLWSCQAPGFKSENAEIETVFEQLAEQVHGRGIFVLDRGADRPELYTRLLERKLRFIIRLVGNRTLYWGNRAEVAEALAARCPMRYAERICRETEDGEHGFEIQYGAMNVRLPFRPEPLRLVVIRGFGEKPMLLLTTLALEPSRKSLWQVVEGYLSRWRVEDGIRFIKQSYRLEDLRLLDYERLRNMMAVLLAAVFFAASWLGASLRQSILVSHITRLSRRFFGVAEFHYYALADGIAALFRRYGKWRSPTPPHEPADPVTLAQGLLLFDSG